MRATPSDTNQSEDCLQLNVWTPANFKPGAKIPVMVLIHGGSFTGGSGVNALYDGSHFAERGVVLVTVNYRLGRLGFFAHPALSAEQPAGPLANYGMMDNLAALAWVQKNIAAFGGDPKNVTAFGESAGGILINDLMASPKSKGLFAKAISESGFGRIPGLPMAQAEKVGAAYATGLGVTATGAEAMKQLRALTPLQLSKAAGQITPILDGTVLPEGPAAAFAAGREQKVPYIAGGNSWEASLFSTATPPRPRRRAEGQDSHGLRLAVQCPARPVGPLDRVPGHRAGPPARPAARQERPEGVGLLRHRRSRPCSARRSTASPTAGS